MGGDPKPDKWWRDRHRSWQVAVAAGRESKGFAEWVERADCPKHILSEPLPDQLRRAEIYQPY